MILHEVTSAHALIAGSTNFVDRWLYQELFLCRQLSSFASKYLDEFLEKMGVILWGCEYAKLFSIKFRIFSLSAFITE
jgi:hypothetical protein